MHADPAWCEAFETGWSTWLLLFALMLGGTLGLLAGALACMNGRSS